MRYVIDARVSVHGMVYRIRDLEKKEYVSEECSWRMLIGALLPLMVEDAVDAICEDPTIGEDDLQSAVNEAVIRTDEEFGANFDNWVRRAEYNGTGEPGEFAFLHDPWKDGTAVSGDVLCGQPRTYMDNGNGGCVIV